MAAAVNSVNLNPDDATDAVIAISPAFNIRAQDSRLEQQKVPAATDPDPSTVPLGVLKDFKGTFAGKGLNLIFRPNSGPPTTTTFPNPINPPAPTPPSEQLLEINLTTETLSFAKELGSTPNRGLQDQNDIFLNGVPYLQLINDVTNPQTGKADNKPSGIHFENGLWMHVPETKSDPILGTSLCRMGSIPHGTTINAQTLEPKAPFPGAPKFPTVDITPFVIGNPNGKIPFVAQTADRTDTPRLPQDLTPFIKQGTITQGILSNPNTVLSDANKDKKILQTTVFTVKTSPDTPALGGGTANISFLVGDANTATGQGENANAVQMEATFWINVVEFEIEVPPWKPGQHSLRLKPKHTPAGGAANVPTFKVRPPHEITKPTTIKVTSNEIQYSQNVFLNFAGLTWPHVSVATLGQTQEVPVPDSAFPSK